MYDVKEFHREAWYNSNLYEELQRVHETLLEASVLLMTQ